MPDSSDIFQMNFIKKYKNHLKGSLFTSLVVGSILILVNHAGAIFTLNFKVADLLHWSLNFLVPFIVSFYSRVVVTKKSSSFNHEVDGRL